MTGTFLSIDQVNALPRPVFVAAFGGVFEHSPWVADGAWERRPWRSLRELHAAMCATVREAGVERQLALIRAHPDLVGRAALAGTLTRASSAEQAAAGLDPGRLSADEVARFAEANAAYQARFDFPFVVCARENAKEAILAGMAERLGNAPEAEITTALGEIERIAWYRLADLVADAPAAARSPGPPVAEPLPENAVDSTYSYEIGYGKKCVPVYRTHARPLVGVATIPESPFGGRANHLLAAEIDTEVYGEDFLPAYTRGDNSMVVATDSMKNFVIRETLAFEGATLEGLSAFLATRFAETYPQLRSLRVTGRELPFAAVPVPAGFGFGFGFAPSDNLFEQRRGDFEEATVRIESDDDGVRIVDHACFRRDLRLMKLTGSAFTAFVRDGYTTLPDRGDRPLYIYMDVGWRYADPTVGFGDDPARFVPSEQVRDLCATVFAEFVSESIQQLVHEMGRRLLERFPQLAEIYFVATNRTRDPFGERDDGSGAKVYSDPFPAYGEITLRMRRESGSRVIGESGSECAG